MAALASLFAFFILHFAFSDGVMIIAHRGSAAEAPENTIPAFRLAVERGADAIEVDVRQTIDSQLVVLHDAKVDRTTDGSGDIGGLTLEQVRSFDAGSWFDSSYSGEKIPTLDEVFAAVDSSVVLILEIKGGDDIYPGIEKRVVEVIKVHGRERRVHLKSFDQDVLRRLRALIPDVPLIYVYALTIRGLRVTIDEGVSFGDIYDLNVEYLQPHKWFLTDAFVAEAHRKGRKVVAWAVDDSVSMVDIIRKGVDAIETDYPALARRVRAAQMEGK